jgi:S1-C subfamily serine protease
VYHAGKTVTIDEKPKQSDRVRENQKNLPFGVKFLDPKEFGLELAAQNGGVQVMDITKDSPFAKYGVEDADVITSIDGVSADSLAIFRRQLRRGVVAESVTLQIRRNKTSLTRVVFFDGIPNPPSDKK